jgi:hypothetical protein
MDEMNRRNTLRLALALSAGAIAGLASERTGAQQVDVTTEMIERRPWREEQVFRQLRILAVDLIDLRIVYNGPNGHEANPPFANGAGPFWRETLGGTLEEGRVRVREVEDRLDTFANQLSEEMKSLLRRNGDRFISWLGELGIRAESRLQVDFLRAQAMFAVFAAVLHGDGRLAPFAEDTWCYPFCG